MNTTQIHTNVELDDYFDNIELDDEERDILDSYERGEWTKAATTSIAQLQESAAAHLSANRLSITLPNDDFTRLQHNASELGISIQDLAARILHASLGNTKEFA